MDGRSGSTSYTITSDPRWQRRQGPERTPSFSRREAQAQGSFNKGNGGDSSLSIVFSPEWVRITTPIGEGAFSRVFEGVYRNPDTGDQSIVAVKILKKNMLKRRSDCLRFIKEAKIMTKITHRNIAACYGIGKYEDDDPQNPGCLFIVQELIRGGNLLHKVYKQMLNRSKCAYTSHEAMEWLMDVAQGMQYLHSTVDNKPLIMHRDLKLENIMLSAEGAGFVAKLVDFGLHKVIDDRIQKVTKRVASEANLAAPFRRNGVSALNAHHDVSPDVGDIDDELEEALAQQRAAAGGDGGSAIGGRGTRSLLSRGSGLSIREEEGEGQEGLEDMAEEVDGHLVSPTSTSKSRLGNRVSDQLPDQATLDGMKVAKDRAAPARRSSMQKLISKMKEIKLKVTGKLGDNASADKSSSTSTTHVSIKPTSRLSSATTLGQESPTSPPTPQTEAEARVARNEALLTRIISQQSATLGQAASSTMNALTLDDSATGASGQPRKVHVGPRRSVTWINEIRYNLTEAVGSWAYMAPEVVLGHPYNEKVDVFSFGVILFEVLNRKLMLVDEIKTDPRKDARAYAERVANGYRPEVPRPWPQQLSALITSCWSQDPHMRPNFSYILDVMEEMQDSGIIAKLDVGAWGRESVFI